MTNKLAFAAGAAVCARYSIKPTRIPARRPNAVRAYKYGPPDSENCEATSAKQAIITPIAAPAINTASTLRFPRSPATVAGNPKMPLPIIEFTASAARLQRPMARTRPVCGDVIAKPFVSHAAPSLELNFFTGVTTTMPGAIHNCQPGEY